MKIDKKIDPVEAADKEKKEKTDLEDMKSLDIENISISDFVPIPEAAARVSHPFEGYPQEKVKIGEYMERGKQKDNMISKTHIVALNPSIEIHQDPSGKNISVVGKKDKRERKVTIPTVHSRFVVDYESGGVNTDIVFDRELNLAGGQVMKNVAVCPSHSARAQICFYLDPKTGIRSDKRYILLDGKQIARLKRVYELIVAPKVSPAERLSKAISGETEEEIDNIPE